jgi:hypothetical protein
LPFQDASRSRPIFVPKPGSASGSQSRPARSLSGGIPETLELPAAELLRSRGATIPFVRVDTARSVAPASTPTDTKYTPPIATPADAAPPPPPPLTEQPRVGVTDSPESSSAPTAIQLSKPSPPAALTPLDAAAVELRMRHAGLPPSTIASAVAALRKASPRE